MVADPLDYRVRAAVAHRKSLTRNPSEECFAAGRAVQRDVANQDVLLGFEGRSARRPHRHEATRESLAAVVVGIALEIERDAGLQPCPETLSRRAGQMNLDRIRRQAFGPVT